MIKLIKLIFVFIHGLITGALLLTSVTLFIQGMAYCEAEKNSGLKAVQNKDGDWVFKKIHNEESVS